MRWIAIGLAAIAASCTTTSGPSCGEGTVLKDNKCVVEKSRGAAVASDSPSPQDPPKHTLLDDLDGKSTLEQALAVVRPAMSDTMDEWSPGGLALTVWASSHLKWSDVAVAKNETSFALVRKDADEARGKRMCTSGTIIQIEKRQLGAAKTFSGLIMTDYQDIISFYTVGSSGSLVSRHRARLCGVVVGTYDYSNSAGGTGHAVSLVGIFDLPENKQNG